MNNICNFTVYVLLSVHQTYSPVAFSLTKQQGSHDHVQLWINYIMPISVSHMLILLEECKVPLHDPSTVKVFLVLMH